VNVLILFRRVIKKKEERWIAWDKEVGMITNRQVKMWAQREIER
jgi:hypothetical protein